ncbi:MAG: plastocyanin/azurin family copper-binding protein [Chthoniobacterales bacterium]
MRRCAVGLVWCCLLLAVLPSRAATVMVDVGPDGTMSFSPDPVEINQGDTVKWVWRASASGYGSVRLYHSVTSGTPSQPANLFDSGIHQSPYSFQVTFSNAGSFPYYCMVHGAMMTSSVEVSAAPTPTDTPSTLGNISTRLPVQAGDNVLIAGFIVTGTQPKKVIVRGIGPSLSFSGALADPFLELHDGSGQLLESNDNWIDSPNKQAIIDSTIPPANDLESAIVGTLPATGAGYTAILRGVNNGTGIGVVEAYDLDRTVDSKLANISTRGLVQTSDNVLIAGVIVVGQTSQKVIVRAIGPSLSVTGKMADPTLELRDSNGGLLEANDNWGDSPNKQAIVDSTIAPSNPLESAIVRTLPANNAAYTAIVRGTNNTTGIAVVEVYQLQ